jgi:hypothetical protein
MSMTSYTLYSSLQYFLTAQNVTRPGSLTVQLHTAAPGDSGANEVGDSGYSAQAATFTVDAGNVASNDGELNFGTATTGYTVTYVSVRDGNSGNILLTQRLTTDKVVAAGAQAIMAAGELRIGGTL